MSGRRALLSAGLLSAAIAVLHIIIIFVGAPAYRYFGAGEEMARRAEAGSAFPALLTAAVTLFFAAFAFYGLAGAAVAPRPPLLRTGLILIGVIYALRGLLLAPQLVAYSSNAPRLAQKDLVFSAVSLVIGLLFLFGTWQAWPNLRTQHVAGMAKPTHPIGARGRKKKEEKQGRNFVVRAPEPALSSPFGRATVVVSRVGTSKRPSHRFLEKAR